MERVKKGFELILVLAMLVTLVACNSNDNSDESVEVTSDVSFTVGFANNNDIYDYCAKFRDYLVEESAALGIEVTVTDAGGDTNVQNGQIDDMIVKEVKVVSAISNDLDGSIPALESAKSAEIPYVSFLTTIRDADEYEGFIYVGSQNYDAGFMQGTFLKDTLPENAKVIYYTTAPNDQQYIDRKAGLMDALQDRTDVEFIAEYNVDGKKDVAMSTTEDCLQAYSEFDAIVCQNDDAALGAVETLKSSAQLDSVITVGIDGSDAALKSIIDGELSMTVLQDARAQAKAGAEIFAQIRDGVNPADIDDVYVPFEIITKDNVESYITE